MQMLLEIFFSPAFYPRTVFRNRRSHNETSEKFASFTRENEKTEIVFFSLKIRTRKKIEKNLLVEMEKFAFVDAGREIYQSSEFCNVNASFMR